MVDLRVVGVCGAGVMGSGIAQVAAQAGHKVIFYDAFPAALEKGMRSIREQLARAESKGKLAQGQAAEIQGRITPTGEVGDLAQAVFVIEAVSERMAVKLPLYKALAEVLSPESIIATNTSGLSITELAAAITHPERVIGTHFFNPAPVMKLVEVVRAAQTADATVEAAKEFITSLGKDVIETLQRETGDQKYRPAPLLRQMVRAGYLGRKTGRGFYHYAGGERPS